MLKHPKVLILFFVENIVAWIICDRIMNTDIYHHNEIVNIDILPWQYFS